MKRVTFIALTAFAFVSLSSCKKDRACTCTTTKTLTTTSGNLSTSSVTTDITVYKKVKKKYAAERCLSYTDTYSGGSTVEDCSLK